HENGSEQVPLTQASPAFVFGAQVPQPLEPSGQKPLEHWKFCAQDFPLSSVPLRSHSGSVLMPSSSNALHDAFFKALAHDSICAAVNVDPGAVGNDEHPTTARDWQVARSPYE